MNKEIHVSLQKRITAVFMTIIMIAGLITSSLPGNAAAGEHTDCVTISVRYNGSPVTGAEVAYIIKDSESNEISNGTATTGDDGVAEIMESSYYSAGYTVSATISHTEYKTKNIEENIADGTADIQVTLSKFDIEAGITPYSGGYDGESHPAATITFSDDESNYNITYKLDDGAESNSIPQIKEVGDYSLKINITRNGYEDYSTTVTPKIEKGTITEEITLEGNTAEYTGNSIQAIKSISGTKTGDTVQYSLDNENWVSDFTTLEIGPDVGEYPIYAKVLRANYNDKIFSGKAEITKTSSTIEFTHKGDLKIQYIVSSFDSLEYDFSAINTGSTGAVSYDVSFPDGDNGIASIDSDGKLTVTDGGKIKVTASVAADKNHDAASVSHEFSVLEKVALEFEDDEIEYVINKAKITDIQNVKINGIEGVLSTGDKRIGDFTYSIEDGYKDILDINSSNKIEITDIEALEAAIGDEDELKVKIFVDMDNTAWSTTEDVKVYYYLVIKFADISSLEKPYDVSGTIGNNGWYKSEVEIIPAATYTISKTIDGNYENSVIYDDQGNTDRPVYIMNTDGDISRKINIDNLFIDTVNPYFVGDAIAYSEPMNTDKFSFYNSEVTITFTAYDETSGIDKFVWKYIREDGYGDDFLAEDSGEITHIQKDGNKYTATLTLPKDKAEQLKGHISLVVYDKAGNYIEKDKDGVVIVVDNISPVASVTYKLKNTAGNQQNIGSKSYYSDDVECTFNITEANFFAEDIHVYVSKDGTAKKEISLSWNSTGSKNVATYTLDSDGDYVISVEYTDKSTNKMTPYQSNTIVIDKTKPILKFEYLDYNDAENSQSATITITEHNFRKEDISVLITAKDITGADITSNDLQSFLRNAKWNTEGDVHTVTISPEFVDAIYNLEIDYKDLALNSSNHISTGEFIVDRTAPDSSKMSVTYSTPVIDTILSNITFGYYNPDVTITFTAYDLTSGVDYFTWSYVKENGTSDTNVSGYPDAKLTAVQDANDKTKFTATITLPLSQAEQLRGHIAFFATDKYANVSETMTDSGHVLVVDTVAPMISVSYSNPVQTVSNKRYYSSIATATLTVTEANFYSEDVVVSITRDGRTVELSPSWRDSSADVHIGTINIGTLGDGDYQFTVTYKDRSGNQMSPYSSDIMVIDATSPNMSVTYANNNLVQDLNGISYYDGANGSIVATVTIIEHNFNSADAVVSVTRDGSNVPVSVSWSSSGDTNTGTFSLDGDGDYFITVTYNDMARNSAATYTSGQLTLDTEIEAPIITINGEKDIDGNAYKDEVIPAVSFEDVNLDSYEVAMVRTSWTDKDIDVSDKFIEGNMSVNDTNGEGEFDEFDKTADNDGIYLLTVSISDKAGHEAESQAAFTVNRYGSVYVYSDYLVDLISDDGKYVQSIEDDLIITEYNADKLLEDSLVISISKDGKPVDEAVYEVTPEINDRVSIGNSGWYQYQYTIDKSNFEDDGIYKISVSSADHTGNKPDINNYEDKTILFRVDSTPPEINSITGLEDDIINATDVDVKYTVYDTIGLKSVAVYVNGEEIDSITDFSDDMNNFAGQFNIKERTSSQDVRIVVEDLAGNITDTASGEFSSVYKFNSSVTVSTNAFVRWFANKPLFVGSIVGFVALLGGGGFLIAFLRRRRNSI